MKLARLSTRLIVLLFVFMQVTRRLCTGRARHRGASRALVPSGFWRSPRSSDTSASCGGEATPRRDRAIALFIIEPVQVRSSPNPLQTLSIYFLHINKSIYKYNMNISFIFLKCGRAQQVFFLSLGCVTGRKRGMFCNLLSKFHGVRAHFVC